jgi:OOP family OmpA-OmpF porin
MLAGSLVMLASCSTVPANSTLKRQSKPTYSFDHWLLERAKNAEKSKSDTMIVMSFSGGGVRAAALAEAVVEQLNKLGLSDQISIISSTSGGSVTAGVIGARGIEGLSELRERFLFHDNTSDLIPSLVPAFFPFGRNRSQVFADYLDRRLFLGSKRLTYGDLISNWNSPKLPPFVILNATDVATGGTFEFTHRSFAHLCSDITSFPLAEGIAASSSFPFLLNPIPIRNFWFDSECNKSFAASEEYKPSYFDPRDDYSGRYRDLSQFIRDRQIHSQRLSYSEDAAYPTGPYRRIKYVHLLDGGLSDNLAARALLRAFEGDVLPELMKAGLTRILLIQVNAKSENISDPISDSPNSPSWIQIAKAVALSPIDITSALSSYISKEYWARLVASSNASAKSQMGHLHFYPVQVDFDQLHPRQFEEQVKVKGIETWWSVDEDKVQSVRNVGQKLLMEHPCFQQFLADINSPKQVPLNPSVSCGETIQVAARTPPIIASAPPPPVLAPPPPPAVVAQKVTFAADAFFDFGRATLRPEAKARLDELTEKLQGINVEVIIAVGHTDSIGSAAANMTLSVKRAESVKAYLVSRGIAPNRVYTEGKGKERPVADNKTPEGRAKNRRVEIEVVGTHPTR